VKPYYQDEWVTIYHGDCREILPQLPKVDLVLTDPPYPEQKGVVSKYKQTTTEPLTKLLCRQLIFWSAKVEFPLDFSAIHIWDKKVGVQSQYERIFERNSNNNSWRVFRHYLINSSVAAKYASDIFTGHPSQKPCKLIEELLTMASKSGDLILDPFLGSGTTAFCAKKLNRKCIGIEIEEKYCEIAAKRCSQGVFDFAPLEIKD